MNSAPTRPVRSHSLLNDTYAVWQNGRTTSQLSNVLESSYNAAQSTFQVCFTRNVAAAAAADDPHGGEETICPTCTVAEQHARQYLKRGWQSGRERGRCRAYA